MTDKDTLQLENDLAAAESLEEFFADNEEIFQKFTPAQYLEILLQEKNLTKSEVAKKSLLNQVYVYHIFAGVEKLYVKNSWDSIILFALFFTIFLSPLTCIATLFSSFHLRTVTKLPKIFC